MADLVVTQKEFHEITEQQLKLTTCTSEDPGKVNTAKFDEWLRIKYGLAPGAYRLVVRT
jgi:hypothetical protein